MLGVGVRAAWLGTGRGAAAVGSGTLITVTPHRWSLGASARLAAVGSADVESRAQPDPPGEGDPAPPWHAVEAAADEPARALPGPERAIVTMLTGVVLAVVLGVLVGARIGTGTIALTLAVAGTWRATSATGPVGLVVRSRGFDVFLCWAAAVVIGVLALTAPGLS